MRAFRKMTVDELLAGCDTYHGVFFIPGDYATFVRLVRNGDVITAHGGMTTFAGDTYNAEEQVAPELIVEAEEYA